MENFFSCDWGTSSFRLKLVEVESLRVLATETGSQGIAETFALWKQTNQPEGKRISFYAGFISDHIKSIEQKLNESMDRLPVILSGMASSNIGMVELPYKKMPFATDGSDLLTQQIAATDQFNHDILLISGACTNEDAMRGEETQLVGCDCPNEKRIYIFPGTHSKHLVVENDQAIDCKTYMTGEFFELLSGKSILSSSVEQGGELANDIYLKSYRKGVEEGSQSNLLNTSFRVRMNILFKKLSKQENYYYLSGLLIGTELKELRDAGFANITVVANRTQSAYYQEAISVLDLPKPTFIDMEEATIRGQWKIYTNHDLNDLKRL